MTLVLALNCVDGLLLVSDSQRTFSTSGQAIKGQVQKLFSPWNNVAWGASGHGGIIQAVCEAIDKKALPTGLAKASLEQVRRSITDTVIDTVRPILQKSVTLPGTQPPGTSFVFAGHVQEGSFIFEIGQDLICTNHIDTGYTAIGSGDIFPYFALAGLAHFNVQSRGLREVKLIAYRVMEDALNVAAFGIGPPIQMVEIYKPVAGAATPSPAHRLSDDERSRVATAVLEWKTLKAETLTKAMGLPPKEDNLDDAG